MKLRGERLVVRLAVVSGLQVLALVLVAWLSVPLSFYLQDKASPQGIVREVAESLHDVNGLRDRVTRMQQRHHVDLTLYDDAGRVVVSNIEPPLDLGQHLVRERATPAPPDSRPLFPRHQRAEGPDPFAPRMWDWLPGKRAFPAPPLMAVYLADGAKEYVLALQLPPLHPSYAPLLITVAIGILVVGFGSVLTARVITRPLERLSNAVSEFGEGEFSTRIQLERRDEVGLLTSAFNQMADRIQALRVAERELLSNVAHELRTPLARIRVALEIAEENDGAKAKRALLGINGDLSELEALLEDVLTATRLQSATQSANLVLRKRVMAIGELVGSVCERFAANHPDRTLIVDAGTLAMEICVDEVLLRRALSNLLENAHKYTANLASPILLRAQVQANDCVFTVEDRGMGIDPDEQSKVFLPFFRGEQSRSKDTGGVGLGLTLAKRIAEAHQGSLSLESSLNVGTSIHLTVPLADRSRRGGRESSKATSNRNNPKEEGSSGAMSRS